MTLTPSIFQVRFTSRPWRRTWTPSAGVHHEHPSIRSCSTTSMTWSSRSRRPRSACGCSWSPKSCSSAACSWPTSFVAAAPEAFQEASHHLSIGWGAFNTAVLIFSSLTMALAVRAAQTGQPARTQVMWLAGTMFLGTVFLGVKVIEYADKFAHHIVPGPYFDKSAWTHPAGVEQFYSLYFIMTGLHALHMIIGIGLMAVIAIMAWRKHFDSTYYTPVEVRACTGTSSTSSGFSCSRCCI